VTSLPDKRIEWLYEHFQGITKRSDQLLVLFGVLFVSAVAILASSSDPIELPFIKLAAGRQTLLGSTLLSAAFTLVAFFGNYDYGERALEALSSALGCDYEEVWLVDTHPTIIDFARYRRAEVATKRRWLARASSALLYPLILVSSLAWLSAIWAHEVWLRDMSLLEATPYVLAGPVFYVAWDRAFEYLRRRARAFRTSETSRSDSVRKPVSTILESHSDSPIGDV
jgi:hypothetical protein